MKIGGLYKYNEGRNIWNTIGPYVGLPFNIIAWLPPGEIFVLLEVSNIQDSIKVLTTKGIVGWIDLHDKFSLKQVDFTQSIE